METLPAVSFFDFASETGLELPDDLSLELWDRSAVAVVRMAKGWQWWLGDLFAFAFRRGGHFLDHALQIQGQLGFKSSTVLNYVAICQRIEQSRRIEGVDFSVHRVVAYMDDRELADSVLRRALEHRWTVTQTRECLKEIEAVPATLNGNGGPPVAVEPDEIARADEAFTVTEATFVAELLPLAAQAEAALKPLREMLAQPTRGQMELLHRRAGAAIDALMAVQLKLETCGVSE